MADFWLSTWDHNILDLGILTGTWWGWSGILLHYLGRSLSGSLLWGYSIGTYLRRHWLWFEYPGGFIFMDTLCTNVKWESMYILGCSRPSYPVNRGIFVPVKSLLILSTLKNSTSSAAPLWGDLINWTMLQGFCFKWVRNLYAYAIGFGYTSCPWVYEFSMSSTNF